MSRPQRHRLLHGYPLAAAMPFADNEVRARVASGDAAFGFSRDAVSPLLVGVLPHPFCNPKIRGCGFCTFPHETFSTPRSTVVATAVAKEIRHRLSIQPDLQQARVDGLYFGGGTANLTPSEPFRMLSQSLNDAFDLTDAEVSLEGVAGRFLHGKTLLVDILQEELGARHFRISMGIQTFSEQRLEQMGRLAFGRPQLFAAVVRAAHQRGTTVSGDLLFNLPSQRLSEMIDDVQRAIEIGLDQICLYHLVLFRGLGTAWSRDPKMIAGLPSNDESAANWEALRETLLHNGFRQTSLTNFERSDFAGDPRQYRYESISYESLRCQVLGFGPAGISFSQAANGATALKTQNPESSAAYVDAVRAEGPVWNRYYAYQQQELELLHFIRRLAALRIDLVPFVETFGQLALDRYMEVFALLVEEGLLVRERQSFTLTPRGMFFSDAIATLLVRHCWQNEAPPSLSGFINDNSTGHM